MLTLRPYQAEALDLTARAEADGTRRQLGVAATGLGKTVMFCALARQVGGRTLILAHRDELVGQAAAKVREVWPEATVGIVKADQNDVHAQVVVASVQTLAREHRLAQLAAAAGQDAPAGAVTASLFAAAAPFSLVVVDEAHHAAADSYRRILAGLDAGQPDGPLLLGVTATPDRGDGQGLDGVFDRIVWSYDLLWGIRSGYLSDVRGLRIGLQGLDLSNVRVSRGDYQAGDAGRALEAADAPQAIARAWAEHAADRRTLVFTPTVATAAAVAEAFTGAGVRAAWVSGETPMDERRRLLAAYSAGEVQVLANCAVLTEGYDEPRTDCVVVARPTRSRALYAQMVGRGTRRHPDKADCLVLDVVGATDEHSLVTIPRLFGLDDQYARGLTDGTGSAVAQVDLQEAAMVAAGQLVAAEADLFRKMRGAGIAWVSLHQPGELRAYSRPLGFGSRPATVHLAERADGTWSASVHPANPREPTVILADGSSLELAQGVAEDRIRQAGKAAVVSASASWRHRQPSPKAVRFARQLGITVDPAMTAGEVSDAIDAVKLRRHHRPEPSTRTGG